MVGTDATEWSSSLQLRPHIGTSARMCVRLLRRVCMFVCTNTGIQIYILCRGDTAGFVVFFFVKENTRCLCPFCLYAPGVGNFCPFLLFLTILKIMVNGEFFFQ